MEYSVLGQTALSEGQMSHPQTLLSSQANIVEHTTGDVTRVGHHHSDSNSHLHLPLTLYIWMAQTQNICSI